MYCKRLWLSKRWRVPWSGSSRKAGSGRGVFWPERGCVSQSECSQHHRPAGWHLSSTPSQHTPHLCLSVQLASPSIRRDDMREMGIITILPFWNPFFFYFIFFKKSALILNNSLFKFVTNYDLNNYGVISILYLCIIATSRTFCSIKPIFQHLSVCCTF